MDYSKYISVTPDFPKKGISFKDISPLLRDPVAFHAAIEDFAKMTEKYHPDVIVGPEARGFLFGAALAYRMNIGFVMARKAGKLPGDTYSVEYSLEYGKEKLEIPAASFQKGQRVLLIDDLLATGGSFEALGELITKAGGIPVAGLTVINLKELEGWKHLSFPCECLVELSALHA